MKLCQSTDFETFSTDAHGNLSWVSVLSFFTIGRKFRNRYQKENEKYTEIHVGQFSLSISSRSSPSSPSLWRDGFVLVISSQIDKIDKEPNCSHLGKKLKGCRCYNRRIFKERRGGTSCQEGCTCSRKTRSTSSYCTGSCAEPVRQSEAKRPRGLRALARPA